MIRKNALELADEVIDAGIVVVGTGVAGLAAALSLSPRRVTVLTKTRLGSGGSSPWAQGGIAAAMADGDDPDLHAVDTLAAGAGLCDPEAVEVLTAEGPRRVRRLIALGARFDRDAEGRLALGREGAHGRRRILHAGGDRTGAEMVRALVEAVVEDPAIHVHERVSATDLVRYHQRITGVMCRRDGRRILYRASAVILATGGFGQLYSKTTNPVENSGDGLAMAARAGVCLADLEMVQFHPTALDVDSRGVDSRGVDSRNGGRTLPLVTEALRGEGAILVDDRGERFMTAIHPDAELAPRDVVARAIWHLQQSGHGVFLDARRAVGDAFPRRFPTVYDHCRRHGIDPRREPIPVTPAAHYAMAGIASDARGRTSLDGLWVCGEVSSTGVHGANRLASNSLLEGLVFGHRAALDVAASEPPRASFPKAFVLREEKTAGEQDLDALRRLMWEKVGLVRDALGLRQAQAELERLATDAGDPDEAANLWTVGRMVTAAALARQESRGSHFRTDFPDADPAWKRRQFFTYLGRSEQILQRAQDAVPGRVEWAPIREIA